MDIYVAAVWERRNKCRIILGNARLENQKEDVRIALRQVRL
jgi:hypothetical protein